MGKFKSLAFLLLALASPVRDACAKIVVNLPAPASQFDVTSTNTQFDLYQAGGANPTPSPGYIDSARGFRYIWTAAGGSIGNAENLVFLDIFTNDTFTLSGRQRLIAMFSHSNTNGSEIPIRRAGVRVEGTDPFSPSEVCSGGLNCQSQETDGLYYSAAIKTGTWYRIGFALTDLCLNAPTGSASSICGSGGVNYASLSAQMLSETITVNIAVVPDETVTHARILLPSSSAQPNPQLKTQNFTLHISDIAPTVTCSGITEEQFYFPGDQQIFLNISNFTSSTQAGPPLANYVYLGNRNTAPAIPPTGLSTAGSEVVDYIGTGGTVQTVGNNEDDLHFENTTTGSDNGYNSVVHAENAAGMVSDIASSCVPSGFTVRTQKISGVLTESKCFIATAAYHDGRAAPVMMLRKFRDRILARYEWGRKFIETYYEHSPAWAMWAWDKPVIRSLALKLLTPLELAAWVTLKLSGAEQVSPAGEPSSSEPYIDRLRKVIPPDPASTTSYTEEQKKSLDQVPADEKPASSEDYTIKEREKLKAEEGGKEPESADGYAEKQRAALPPENYRANPSELIKSGRDRKLGYGDVPTIKNAVSIRMGINPGMQVSVNGANPDNSFSNIYGEDWKPELLFHFERQLFHSETLGSLGLTADTGISYAEGFGRLQFGFAGSNESQTQFSFIQVPLLLGANYRFNFFRLFRPYVGAGVGTMLFTELRNDERPDQRGYSFIYDAHVGLSFLMDFLDPDTARDSYLSQGVQHTYLFAEYFYLNTLGSSVVFNRSGIYSGFLFEL